MKVIETAIVGVKIIEPTVFGDERGFFLETFQQERYQRLLNINLAFVQDNHSRSARGYYEDCIFKRPSRKGN